MSIIIINFALSFSAAAQDNRGIFVSSERLALVIGNNAYQTAPLRNPVNDAEDMSRVLSTLGFKVIMRKNVDRRSMEDSIRSFGRQLRDGGVGLFYFAGHGMQVGGRNYLIPVNARIESESDIKYEAVDAGLVLGKMEDANNQLNIVILDACRNNPFSRNFRTAEQGLARMDAPKGALIAYSTAPGEVAADGPERNGVFTKYLIRHMQTPNLPVEQVLKRVRINVAEETAQRQIPWESSSLMGDFYFKIEKAPESAEIHTPTTPANPLKEPLGSLPKSEAITPQLSQNRKKLAILPFYFSTPLIELQFSSQTINYELTKKAIVSALEKMLINDQDLVPTYSYYRLNEKYSYTKIDQQILDQNGGEKLWAKSTGKPNINNVMLIAKKIDADAVFLCNCKSEELFLYLIDVDDKAVFSKEYIYDVRTGYSNAPKFLIDFFANYKKYRTK